MKFLLKLAYALFKLYSFFVRPITLGVRLILPREGRILLVRHTYQDAWFLPGGGVKRGETLAQAARREAREECGAELGELELVGAYSQYIEYKHDHIVLFACKSFTLSSHHDHEIEQVKFFAWDDLPPDLAPGHRNRILEYLRSVRGSGNHW